MINLWIGIEWVSILMGIVGTILASTFKEKIRYSFLLWIMGGIMSLFLHILHTKQHGLLLLSITGLIISSFGFYETLKKKAETEKQVGKSEFVNKILNIGLYLCLSIGVLAIGNFLINDASGTWYQSKSFDLAATTFNLSGLILLSMANEKSKYCWIFWGISNAMFALITFNVELYGIFFQQIIFSALNIWGIINWFIIKKETDGKKS